jgi:ABC-2 type transport system permease protein
MRVTSYLYLIFAYSIYFLGSSTLISLLSSFIQIAVSTLTTVVFLIVLLPAYKSYIFVGGSTVMLLLSLKNYVVDTIGWDLKMNKNYLLILPINRRLTPFVIMLGLSIYFVILYMPIYFTLAFFLDLLFLSIYLLPILVSVNIVFMSIILVTTVAPKRYWEWYSIIPTEIIVALISYFSSALLPAKGEILTQLLAYNPFYYIIALIRQILGLESFNLLYFIVSVITITALVVIDVIVYDKTEGGNFR